MKRLFLVLVLLINAPAYAEEKDFAAFLKDYMAFKEKRDAQNLSHTARFSGKLTFKDECSFYSDAPCPCPTGNNYLQCLVSAQATIHADPNDIGGRAYVLVMAGNSALNHNRQWVPLTQRGVYTAVLNSIGQVSTINIPIPDSRAIEQACSGNPEPFTLMVGYGATMPMDIELARRMKAKSAETGQPFDEEAYIFSRARFNGTRPKKAGTVGTVSCRPVVGG